MNEKTPLLPCEVRPLKPTDISKAVELHMAAFPDFFLTFLGPTFLRLLYGFYAADENAVALAGEKDGQIVATVLGTNRPGNFYRRMAQRHFVLFAWACFEPLLRRPAIFRRLVRALLYRGDPPLASQNGALLASICVDPNTRGSGIGNAMLVAFEREMWKRNADFVYLTTDRDENQAVQAFYGKQGWSVQAEFTTSEGRRMQRYWKWRPNGESSFG